MNRSAGQVARDSAEAAINTASDFGNGFVRLGNWINPFADIPKFGNANINGTCKFASEGGRIAGNLATIAVTTVTGVGGIARASAARSAPVAVGRDMAGRVVPYAEAKDLGWYRGTPRWVPRRTIERLASTEARERVDLFFNKLWIRSRIAHGAKVVDIGEPAGYPPSRFYDMELEQLRDYWNYVRDTQP